MARFDFRPPARSGSAYFDWSGDCTGDRADWRFFQHVAGKITGEDQAGPAPDADVARNGHRFRSSSGGTVDFAGDFRSTEPIGNVSGPGWRWADCRIEGFHRQLPGL